MFNNRKSALIDRLMANTTYEVAVVGTNRFGSGEFSDVVDVKTKGKARTSEMHHYLRCKAVILKNTLWRVVERTFSYFSPLRILEFTVFIHAIAFYEH